VHGKRKAPSGKAPSGFHGVTADKKRWRARITYGGKQYSLGTFGTKQEAALAYDRAARQCGEDKPLNHESTAAHIHLYRYCYRRTHQQLKVKPSCAVVEEAWVKVACSSIRLLGVRPI
jgi:hypothetical protein